MTTTMLPALRRRFTARILALPLLGLAVAAAVTAPVHAGTTHDMPYAMVRGDGQTMTMNDGDSDDRGEVQQVRSKVKGDFIWFRDNGHGYVIQDPATLVKARAAWAPVDRLGEQMKTYGRDMEQQGKAMGDQGRQMGEAAARAQPDQRKLQAQQEQIATLGARLATLSNQITASTDEGERARLHKELGKLNMQISDIALQMRPATPDDAQRRQMEDTNRRMKEGQVPMQALGQKMKALGKDMERESHTADATVRSLIHDARAHGLAHPAPQG